MRIYWTGYEDLFNEKLYFMINLYICGLEFEVDLFCVQDTTGLDFTSTNGALE